MEQTVLGSLLEQITQSVEWESHLVHRFQVRRHKRLNQSTLFNEGDTQQSGTDKPVALGFRIE